MNYLIKNVLQMEDTVITNVDITLNDLTVINIDIPHFRPNSIDQINNAIADRVLSEQAKYDALQQINQIISQIPTGQTVNVE
jgi:hypothetical protein